MQFYALDNNQLQKLAPSIFATRPWEQVSDRYAFIPTIEVVTALRGEGFLPVRAQQSRCLIPGKREFTKHMIRFRREQDMATITPHSVNGNAHHFYKPGEQPEIPEIVLVNSHDRSSSYQLSAGLFRLACSNGLIVKSSDLGGINIRHSGNIVDNVIEGSYSIIEQVPQIMERVDSMKRIPLTFPQELAFANAAIQLRYPNDDNGKSTSPITPQQLLQTRRGEDFPNNLWVTFNKVQENFMRGGLETRNANGRKSRTRAITSVGEDVRLNKALWVLAEELGKQVA